MAKKIVSASLLKTLKYLPSPATKRRIKADFSLGMGEWEEWSSADEGDDFQLQSLARKKCTAARSSEPAKCERFAEPATLAELEKLSAGVIPKNTQKNEQWALRAFNEWIHERNKCEDKCPKSILETENTESLAKWLSLFTIEVRKKDGELSSCHYPHVVVCLAAHHAPMQQACHLIFLRKRICVFGSYMVQWRPFSNSCTKMALGQR